MDIARAYGYSDGSVITQILKSLQAQAGSTPAVASRMLRLKTKIGDFLSAQELIPFTNKSIHSRCRGNIIALF